MMAPSTESSRQCGSLQGGKTCQTSNTDSKQKYKKFWKRAGTREPGPEFMWWGARQGWGPGKTKRCSKVQACVQGGMVLFSRLFYKLRFVHAEEPRAPESGSPRASADVPKPQHLHKRCLLRPEPVRLEPNLLFSDGFRVHQTSFQ